MFKITLADGTVVWVDGSCRQEVDFVLGECGVLATEEQNVNTHAPQDAKLFDLSGTQNDFNGKQRLRHFALERYILALKQQLAEPPVPTGLNSDLEGMVEGLLVDDDMYWPTERAQRLALAACVLSMLRIQQALNQSPDWNADTLDAVAEQVRAAGLPLLDELDADLSVDELAEKYAGKDGGWGQHPLFTRQAWREVVANDDTLLGYWAWVHHRLNED